MIEIDGLGVRFGGVTALNALTASLDAAVTGLVGPNGAGKTTLLNVLSGFITPTAGSVRIDGQDIGRLATHRRITSATHIRNQSRNTGLADCHHRSTARPTSCRSIHVRQ